MKPIQIKTRLQINKMLDRDIQLELTPIITEWLFVHKKQQLRSSYFEDDFLIYDLFKRNGGTVS